MKNEILFRFSHSIFKGEKKRDMCMFHMEYPQNELGALMYIFTLWIKLCLVSLGGLFKNIFLYMRKQMSEYYHAKWNCAVIVMRIKRLAMPDYHLQ